MRHYILSYIWLVMRYDELSTKYGIKQMVRYFLLITKQPFMALSTLHGDLNLRVLTILQQEASGKSMLRYDVCILHLS